MAAIQEEINTVTDIEEEEMMCYEELIQQKEEVTIMSVGSRPPKRSIEEANEEEEQEGEWKLVKGRGKKVRQGREEGITGECEKENVIYISCNKPLPKQFELARLMKAQSITGILQIKYINDFRIKLIMQDRKAVEAIISNEEFIKKEWRFNKLMEVAYSYGVMRDVDLNLKEEDIINGISSPGSIQLVSVVRFNRRKKEGEGWEPSETVRLCFKGKQLPPFVYVYDMKVMIEPYVFPVTRCYSCWRLGHVMKMCPSRKQTCPKCGSNQHANCDTKDYKCVNCSGNHMALSRSCPAYLKEKKIREIMSQNNCTYIKGAQIYASLPVQKQNDNIQATIQASSTTPTNRSDTSSLPIPTDTTTTYSDVLKDAHSSSSCSEKSIILQSKSKPKKSTIQKENKKAFSWDQDLPPTIAESETQESTNNYESNEPEKINFSELISRIKEVIFIKQCSVQTKVSSCIKLIVEWLILVAVDNISDWPILKLFLGIINNNG